MDAETWFTADEALANGFIDAVNEKAAAKNTWDLSAYNNAPKITPPVDNTADWEAVRQRNANRLRLHEIG